jgi:Flp pilus assembly pilin Flp
MVEYAVVAAALAAALFLPIKDAASPDQPRTAIQVVIHALQQGYQNISAALSIPE